MCKSMPDDNHAGYTTGKTQIIHPGLLDMRTLCSSLCKEIRL
jgi:hypothetical protein